MILRASLAAAAAVLLAVLPLLVNDYVLSAILVPWLALALAASGQNIVTGYAGQLSVGSAAFMSVGAFAAYDVHLYVPGAPLLVAFAVGGIAAAAAGALFGLPSLRIRGFYLVVSTLAAQFFVEWLFTKVGWFSGNSASGVITAPPLRIAGIDLSSPSGHYWLALGVVAVLTVALRNIVQSRIGRSWMAVRDMETAAIVSGVETRRAKLLAFAVGAFYCGIAGALWAFAYLGTVEPHGFDLDRSFQVLFMAILGGLGRLTGPFLGAAFIVLFPIALDLAGARLGGGSVDPGLLQTLEKIVFGALVIFFLVKQPAGLARLVSASWIQLRRPETSP
ncbi:branched-chain amino acid ABC transporter permease [Pendulispora rubella]|uniref:Branched-chain amino acid ABC transporter permease n=1 Tax=Pendulispora rubella TaxID=2741070 RepID=A0ABZ2KYC7_9BACT